MIQVIIAVPVIIIGMGIYMYFRSVSKESFLSRRNDRRLVIATSVIALTISILGNVVLVGLPGALILTLAQPALWLLTEGLQLPIKDPDTLQESVWLVCLSITFIWPIVIPFLYAFVRGSHTRRKARVRCMVAVALAYIWSVVLCAFLLLN